MNHIIFRTLYINKLIDLYLNLSYPFNYILIEAISHSSTDSRKPYPEKTVGHIEGEAIFVQSLRIIADAHH